MKTILVFSHDHNTFDKRKLLENPHPEYFKPSNKTVDMFIRNKNEEDIKDFFLKTIDKSLKNYKPGEPCMKPDALLQMKQIEEERQKLMQSQNNLQQLMINEEGKPPRPISPNEIAQLMNKHIDQIKVLTEKNNSLEKMVSNLQKKISKNVTNDNVIMNSINISPTINKPVNTNNTNNQFIDILLSRINELEKTISDLKKNSSNEIKNNKINQSIREPNTINREPNIIKSKTTP